MTVAESIKATAKKAGAYDGNATYRGLLRVSAQWGDYSRVAGPERLTKADALDDVSRMRQDWIAVNQLPE